jgi:hypothetical protein
MCEGRWGTTGKSIVCSNLPHWVIRGLFQNHPIVHHLQLVVFARSDAAGHALEGKDLGPQRTNQFSFLSRRTYSHLFVFKDFFPE